MLVGKVRLTDAAPLLKEAPEPLLITRKPSALRKRFVSWSPPKNVDESSFSPLAYFFARDSTCSRVMLFGIILAPPQAFGKSDETSLILLCDTGAFPPCQTRRSTFRRPPAVVCPT